MSWLAIAMGIPLLLVAACGSQRSSTGAPAMVVCGQTLRPPGGSGVDLVHLEDGKRTALPPDLGPGGTLGLQVAPCNKGTTYSFVPSGDVNVLKTAYSPVNHLPVALFVAAKETGTVTLQFDLEDGAPIQVKLPLG